MYEFFELLLIEQGKTVADVCRATGIGHSTISNWKRRRNKISFENGKKIAEYLGVSVDYLYGEEKEQQNLLDRSPNGVRFADVESLLFDRTVLRDAANGKRILTEDGVMLEYRRMLARLRHYYSCIKNLSSDEINKIESVVDIMSKCSSDEEKSK